MKIELVYLLLTAILTGVLWIPVVIGYVKTRGPLTDESYKVAPTSPLLAVPPRSAPSEARKRSSTA